MAELLLKIKKLIDKNSQVLYSKETGCKTADYESFREGVVRVNT